MQTQKNIKNLAVTTYFGSRDSLPKRKTQMGLKDAWLYGHSCSDTNM